MINSNHRRPIIMARTEKKPVHNVQMAEGKWDIIRQFLQEYGTQSASDIQDARFVFVFTPKHGSWLNLIESFFRKMTKQMLKGIRVRTKQELADRIYLYFEGVNRELFGTK